MSPETLIALRLLSEAVWYAANDSEHATRPLKKLDGLLDVVESQWPPEVLASIKTLNERLDAVP